MTLFISMIEKRAASCRGSVCITETPVLFASDHDITASLHYITWYKERFNKKYHEDAGEDAAIKNRISLRLTGVTEVAGRAPPDLIREFGVIYVTPEIPV